MTALATESVDLTPVLKLTRDLRSASATLSDDEARFLVDAYYTMQKQRIRAGNQVTALTKSGEPHAILGWYQQQSDTLEKQVKGALGAFAKSRDLGRWAMSVTGVGPVIAAGLLAHINIKSGWRRPECDCATGEERERIKARRTGDERKNRFVCAGHIVPTAGHIWSFAGLNPSQVWEKGQKRPFNASLKTLCWKLGESFVKVKGRESDLYGKVYEERRHLEGRQNDGRKYADQAAAIIKSRPTHAQRKTYAEGKLPDGHLHMRAKRYAVKLFLSHYHTVGHYLLTGKLPPRPYAFDHLGHAHLIHPPNFGDVVGLAGALERW